MSGRIVFSYETSSLPKIADLADLLRPEDSVNP